MSHITDATEAVATTLQQEAASGRASYYDMAEAAIAKATPHIRAALFDELIADAFGESFCALELQCDTGSFGGSEYLGTLADWLRARKAVQS